MDFYLIVKNAYALYCVYHQKSVSLQRFVLSGAETRCGILTTFV